MRSENPLGDGHHGFQTTGNQNSSHQQIVFPFFYSSSSNLQGLPTVHFHCDVHAKRQKKGNLFKKIKFHKIDCLSNFLTILNPNGESISANKGEVCYEVKTKINVMNKQIKTPFAINRILKSSDNLHPKKNASNGRSSFMICNLQNSS